ncbi:MAG: TlpA family protein disulfide reductase [Candidatus Wallbacteria bacterium]|nr:TlpA family protein disulfide reductase [Candidatus Wallbacteria bacterium]MBI4868293.1 TlpA family protein disulfide reductase [Candidatus Wallbacteria bacterium]
MSGKVSTGRVLRVGSALLAALLCWGADPAWAARSPLSAPGSAGATGVATAAAPDAAALVKRAIATLDGAQSYHAETRAAVEVTMPGQQGKPQRMERTISVRFAKPLKMAIESDLVRVVSDGVSIWTVIKPIQQFRQMPAPKVEGGKTDLLGWFQAMVPGASVPKSVAASLSDWQAQLTRIVELGPVRAEPLAGRPGWRLTGRIVPPVSMGVEPIEFGAWFRESDGVPRSLELKARPPARGGPMAGRVPPATFAVTFDVDFLGLDEPMPPETFAFKAPAGYSKVDRFVFNAPKGKQRDLLGKPAPDFSGQDMDGKPLTLKSLAGRVVVLDFWATWCPPCVRAIPRVQDLARRFEKKAVTVIGVNQDHDGAEPKIRRFLKEKGIRFRQKLDPQGEIGTRYGVTAIPCTVVIDPRGLVHHVQTGFSEESEEELVQMIESLLKTK